MHCVILETSVVSVCSLTRHYAASYSVWRAGVGYTSPVQAAEIELREKKACCSMMTMPMLSSFMPSDEVVTSETMSTSKL